MFGVWSSVGGRRGENFGTNQVTRECVGGTIQVIPLFWESVIIVLFKKLKHKMVQDEAI